MKLNRIFFLPVIIMILFLSAPIASAHGVYVFANVEGDTVYTESKFLGGKPVKNGSITVYTLEDVILLEGNTDDNGMFTFKHPKPAGKQTGLKIVLNAGTGHGAEWLLKETSFDAAGDGPDHGRRLTSAQKDRKGLPEDARLAEMIRAEVDQALDEKLGPVNEKLRTLLNEQAKGPSIKDILGGLGYIIGLVGIAAFFNFRRKNPE